MDRRQFLQAINANGMSAMLPASAFVSGSSSGPTQMAPSPATDDRAFVEVAATPWNIPKIGIVSVGGIGRICLPHRCNPTVRFPYLIRSIAIDTYCTEFHFMNSDHKVQVDLEVLEPVAHTAFCADVNTTMVDLRQAPFRADALAWQHPSDNSATQAFANVARLANVGAIQYQSVRDPSPAWCVALLTPTAFAKPKPHPSMQTWWLAVRSDAVVWRRDNDSLTFSSAAW